jgi:hypothetical protein
MDDISDQDKIQQFQDTLILYKGKPCKVKQIGPKIKIFNLVTQRPSFVEFSLKEFAPPSLRLGFVNIDEAAVYVSRKHIKQFQIGLSKSNCSFFVNDNMYVPDRRGAIHKLASLECPEFSDMLFGHYPKLEDAFAQAKEFKGAVAFDRQFAIDCRKQVFYKRWFVGYYEGGKKIVFDDKYQYLSLLLNGEYEKAKRTFGKEANQG